MQPVSNLASILSTPKKIIIVSHQKPDGDAMGSSLGLLHVLQQQQHTVDFISPTNWATFFNWMPSVKSVINFESNETKATQLVANADVIFCLDFNTMNRTKKMEKILLAATCTKVLIDHHTAPQMEQFAYGTSNPTKCSTCEMVYDFIMESGWEHLLNSTVATCLYTGLITDTGSFHFPITSPAAFRMAAKLKEIGVEHPIIYNHLFDNFLEDRLHFLGHSLLHRLTVLYKYNTALMHIPKADLRRFNVQTGDTEGLVNYLLTLQGIEFGALAIDRDEEVRWSFRSKSSFDVATFARLHFEGGGHFNAAGGRSADSLQQSTDFFKEVIKQYAPQIELSTL